MKVDSVSGHELPGGYRDALDHNGNDAIFTAVVRELKPAKKFKAKAGDSTFPTGPSRNLLTTRD